MTLIVALVAAGILFGGLFALIGRSWSSC